MLIEKGFVNPFDARNEKFRKQEIARLASMDADLPEVSLLSSGKFPATVSITLQPKEVFESAFLEIIPGVALYDALVCNNTDSGMSIDGGKVLQAVHPKVEPISAQLYALTALRGRKKNWKYKAAKVGEWAAYGATLLFSSGTITVGSDLLRTVPPLVLDASNRLAEKWSATGLDPALLMTEFLTSETQLILDARQCRSLPLLGRYRGQTPPFEVPIQ